LLGTLGTGVPYVAPPPYPTNFYLNFNPAGGTGSFFFKRARYWDYKLTDDELIALTDISLVPSLDLVLTGPTLDPRITCTRNSVATYTDVNGIVQTVSGNTPRFDYDPVTHAPRGLWSEEARTNLCLQSGDFTNASWLKTNATLAAGTPGPNGATTGSGVIPSNGSFGILYQNITLTAGTTYTLSCFFKSGTDPRIVVLVAGNAWADTIARGVTFDLSLGSIWTVTGGSASGTITPVGNGWYRCAMTFTPDTTISTQVQASRSYAAGNGIAVQTYSWGAQLEAGPFVTSYIPTTTATVSRGGEVISIPTAGGWLDPTQGTLVADNIQPFVSTVQSVRIVAVLYDGTSNNRLQLGNITGPARQDFEWWTGGVGLYGTTPTGFPTNQINKQGVTYNTNGLALFMNGVKTNSAVGPYALPTGINLLGIGRGVGGSLSGTISRIRYYPRVLTDAQMQTVTT
jgi:hypothetical protein